MNVFHRGEQVGEFGEFVIVGGEEGAGASVLLEMLDDGPGDGEAVEGGGAAADFVEEDEAGRGGVIEDGGDFTHFHEKSGTATGEIIAGADAGENAVGKRELGLTRGNVATHLGHEDEERGLAEVSGLAAHVGAGDEKKLLTPGFEAKIVGNETLTFLLQQFFDDGMTAADDEEFAGVVEFGANVIAVGSELGERGEDVELGDSGGSAAEAGSIGGDAGANVDEELALDFVDAFVGGEDFAFVFFEFGRSETLGVDEGLLALVIGGSEMEIGFGNFNVVAEDLVVADFEGVDGGALALALFHGGDDLLGVQAEVAEFVEFGVIAGADDARLGGDSGRFVGDRFIEKIADVGEFVDLAVELVKQAGSRFGGGFCGHAVDGKFANDRKLGERFAKGDEFARHGLAEGDAAGDALEVLDVAKFLADFAANDGLFQEMLDGIEASFDGVLIEERA